MRVFAPEANGQCILPCVFSSNHLAYSPTLRYIRRQLAPKVDPDFSAVRIDGEVCYGTVKLIEAAAKAAKA
jgi:hypothetical protein